MVMPPEAVRMVEHHTFEIVGEDDTRDDVTIPAALIELFTEDDEPATEVVGDVVMLGFAQRIHALVHHGHGGADADLEAIEAATMEQFEDRFGASYAELTGHAH